MANQERRRAPRIKSDDLSLKLYAGGFDIATDTLNISSSGLYCKVDRQLPLMSRVKLMIMIPGPSKNDAESKAVEVEGVVVRAHPVIIEGRVMHYDVAIFFDNIEPKAKDLITGYIARKNTSSTGD